MARKLAVNVAVDGEMYGPDFPNAGDPPASAKLGDHVYEGSDEPEVPVVRRAAKKD